MEYLTNLVLIFFAFSILGWCIEVTLKYFEFHRFINRGFLTGPWLPIYGTGAVFITVTVRALAPLESGIGIVLDETKLEDFLEGADIVVTGEGRLDAQTVLG